MCSCNKTFQELLSSIYFVQLADTDTVLLILHLVGRFCIFFLIYTWWSDTDDLLSIYL